MSALVGIIIISLTACQKEIKSDFARKDFNNSLISKVGNEKKTKKERKVLFVSNRDGNDEVYCMNADGSNLILLTRKDVHRCRESLLTLFELNHQHS